eukprot:TRINITY_DN32_c0_g1_i1.p1 TRINITY_DN32_c0_g1~~TRINITY_DN32_c0_g1_i1.p1  ORF type:complete len:299 (-),score=59.92 TRINITY_DN32_c0_g1_i1:92-988(-)
MRESSSQDDKKKKKPQGESFKHLFAGGVAGAVSRTVVSPLERLKILFQVQPPKEYTSIYGSLRKIYVEEGLMGYMKGNGTNVIRIVPYSAVQFAAYEQFANLIRGENDDLTPVGRLIAGGLAGLTSVTATYPLDLVRTRLSCQSPTEMKYKGIVDSFNVIYREEGPLAFYKGINATLIGVAPYVGLNFMFYETLKSFVKKNIHPEPTTVQLLSIGGISGAIAQTITYPCDVLRRKMQMQGFSADHPNFKNTLDCIKYTWKTQRIVGFYKGLIPNYLKVVPSISIAFVVYENVKKWTGA